jgi:hypothetical protein
MNNNKEMKDLVRSRPITSYEELGQERERLKLLLKAQEAQIKKDVQELKAEFKPLVNISNVVGKFVSRENHKDAVVSAGTNITIDLIANSIFAKSNFFVRSVLPALLKNFTSHYLPNAISPLRKPGVSADAIKRQPSAPAGETISRTRPYPDPAVTQSSFQVEE